MESHQTPGCRGMLDATTKGLACFTVALRCVPFVLPDHWQGARIFEDLPGGSTLWAAIWEHLPRSNSNRSASMRLCADKTLAVRPHV